MVLLSSCVFLVINFLITPLISGLFDDATLTKLVSGNVDRGTLYPSNEGNYTLSSGFLFSGYDYAWLDGLLPSFLTPSYALLPVINGKGVSVGNET